MKLVKYLFLFVVIAGYYHAYARDSGSTNSQKNSSVQTIAFSTSSAISIPGPKGNGYQPISFDVLGGYDYRERIAVNGVAMTNKVDQIPQNVKDLNGKKVIIQGYLYPMELESDGTIKDFLLLRNQIYCCFGDAVRINEWISVSMSNGKPLKENFTPSPITIYGTLEVGPKYDGDDTLLNLYRMKADKVIQDK